MTVTISLVFYWYTSTSTNVAHSKFECKVLGVKSFNNKILHFLCLLLRFLLLIFLLLIFLFFLLLIFLLFLLSSSSSYSSSSSSTSWREKLKPVHLEKVLGQLKNLTFFYLWCNLYYRARASSDESFLTCLTLPFGDLGSNKASKTPTEIFYTLCRKLWHIEKYSTLDVENCDRQTDRPTKRGTEAPARSLKIFSQGYISWPIL